LTSPKTFVVIVGPPAVGKMTVGLALSAQTGFPLFHNHVPIEAVLPVFDFGSPEFNRLVSGFRQAMLREVAQSELDGLIYTIMFDFADPREIEFLGKLRSQFAPPGWRVVVAELEADLEVRLERNASAERLDAKPSKRDVDASRARLLAAEDKYQLNSNGALPHAEHVKLNNTTLTPEEAASRIVAHFQIMPSGAPSSWPQGPAT
jgi:hypothetical protein